MPHRPIRPAAAAPEADEMIVARALRWALRCHAVTGGEFVMCIENYRVFCGALSETSRTETVTKEFLAVLT